MGLRSSWVVGLVFAAGVPGSLLAAPDHEGSVAACGTPRSVQETLFLHQQRLRSEEEPVRSKADATRTAQGGWEQFLRLPETPRQQESGPRLQPVSAGEIALIEAAPGLVLAPNPVDLSGRRVTITPRPFGYTVSGSALPPGAYVGETGIPVDLEDDDFAVIELPFAFPYYGEEHTRGFVHSDGNFSFVYPEWSRLDRNYSRAAGGPPRITPLFQDLDPSEGGQVLVSVQGGSLTVTWHEVPLWAEFGLGDRQTIQMTLFADGRIEFRYGDLNTPHGVVGVFPGEANREAVSVDMSRAVPTTVAGQPIIAEVFSDKDGIDEFAVVQEFYRHHDDAYDSLILFNDFDINASGASLAHAWPVRNHVEGTGEAILDYGPYFGSERRLAAFVNMGAITDYPVSPLAPIPALPHSSLLTILAHELAHRYLAYAPWKDPATGMDTNALLGRQLAHWSFYFNSGASVVEGNAIRDNGPDASPRFETVGATQGYSQLDRYFMGFVDPAQVGATFLVANASGGRNFGNAARSPEVGVQFDGTRKEVRIEDIIAAAGERRPDWTVSQRHFRYGFALLVEDANSPDPVSLRKLNTLRANWRAYAAAQLAGAATTATELVNMLHLSTFPAGGVIAGGGGTARVTIAEPRATDLRVSLEMEEPLATVPRTVVIPAGEVFAEFRISGLEPGVSNLTARASEAGYDTAVTRLNVREGLAGLELLAFHRRTVFGVAGAEAAEPLSYRVVDENRVPYSGITLQFESSVSGAASIPDAVTDFDGRAEFDWTLADQPGGQLLKATVKGEPSAFAVTSAAVADQEPSIVATDIVNAASGESAVSGRGLAPGSLVTIHGAGLATQPREADTLLVFGNPTLPYTLGGTWVQVGGAPAPIVSVSPAHVTFQMPYALQPGTTDVVVSTYYGRSEFRQIPVTAVQPGIFPDRVGKLPSASVVRPGPGNGQAEGSAGLFAYATGLGAVTPTVRPGRASQSLPPSRVVARTEAWVDGREAVVQASTLALYEAGVYEVVIEVPEGLEAGKHTLWLAVDGVTSNTVEFEWRLPGSPSVALPFLPRVP